MSCAECRKVEVDLVGEQKPTAQSHLGNAKTSIRQEKPRDDNGFLLLLLGGILIIVGGVAGFGVSSLTPESVDPDFDVLILESLRNELDLRGVTWDNLDVNNITVRVSNSEHLALAGNQQTILSSLVTLQVQHLCGSNLLVEDSNQLVENEQGAFVTYSCYAKIGEAT